MGKDAQWRGFITSDASLFGGHIAWDMAPLKGPTGP